jgi:cardiolipin synthase
MALIDGRIGWVGGAGFEDHFLDGRFHDLFVRVEGPIVHQLQLVFLASLRRLGGSFAPEEVPSLFPHPEPTPGDAIPAVALHNAPDARPITEAMIDLIESSRATLDVVNPYLSDRAMVNRLRAAARRGVRVRLLAPAAPNNWASGSAQRFYHAGMLADGIEIWGFPRMVHAKALVRDGMDVLVGTCNLEVWSLRRFFEINLRLQSADLAQLFEARLFGPDFAISEREGAPQGVRQRAVCAGFAAAWPII